MRSRKLAEIATAALEDLKARDIRMLDVRRLTSVADYMIVATGTSDRHVKSIADRVVERATTAGCPPLGVEGTGTAEWILVDLQDVIVHVMQARARDFYKLEALWDLEDGTAAKRR